MRIRQALAALLPAALLAAAQAEPLSLQQTLAAARTNFDVSIAAHAAAAAQADIAAADRAPVPQLTAKMAYNDSGAGPGNWYSDRRVDKSLGVDWTWERGGKRALRTDAARHGASAAAAELDAARLQQALAAQAAFFELLAAQGRIEQFAEIERGMQRLADAARRRVGAGDLALQDAARATIEAERARADSEGARLELQRARLALAPLIGRDADAATLEASADDWPPVGAPAPPADTAALADADPDVRAAAAHVQAAESALAGSQALRHNDLTWGVSVNQFPGVSTNQVELRVVVPLAWGDYYEGEIGRARAQRDAARDALDRARLVVRTGLLQQRAELDAAWRRWHLYDAQIVPRSREVTERAEFAYGRGALSLTDLLDARRTLRAALLDALAARTDLAKATVAWQLRTRADPT